MSSPAVAAAPEAGAAPKSRKMLFIIIAAVVLLGGGAGAFFFLKGGDAAKDGEHAEAKAEPRGAAIYVGLEPPFVVNFEATENVRFLQIAVQVMTRDAHVAEVVKNNDPVIRNDLLLLFGSQKSADVASLEGKEKLRGEALEVIRRIVTAESGEEKHKEGHKPGTVEAVYFTSFVMQ